MAGMEVPKDPRPRRLVVTLPAAARDRLFALARRELRDPRDEAQLLIIEGLDRADGTNPIDRTADVL